MNITIITAGTLGDIIPYLSIGIFLSNKKHNVKLMVDKDFRDMFPDNNIKYFYFFDPYKLRNNKKSENIINSGSNKDFITEIGKNNLLFHFLEDCKNAAHGSDIILYGNLGFAAPHLAEAFNYLAIPISLTPTYVSHNFPSMNKNFPYPFKKILNYSSHIYSEVMFWKEIKKTVNLWREKSLNIKPINSLFYFLKIRKTKVPFIYLFDEKVFPRPNDWPNHAHIVGYVGEIPENLKNNKTKQIKEKINNFISSGETPIVITFGPAWKYNKIDLLDICINSISKSNKRAIIINPYLEKDYCYLNKNILTVSYISYIWLFPKVKTIIHHGGRGVTHDSIFSGTPSFGIPLFGDQFIWSKCLINLQKINFEYTLNELSIDNLTSIIDKLSTKEKDIRKIIKSLDLEINNQTSLTNLYGIIINYYNKKQH